MSTRVVEKIAGGFGFTEGPAWLPEGRLLFSDIPANRLYVLGDDGAPAVFREPSGKANGNTVDQKGRLHTCEDGVRRLTRTEADGSVVLLADSFDGKKLNAPNDLVVHSDGSVWFTDPTYGLGNRQHEKEQPCNGVYRIASSGAIRRVAEDFNQPNGLCFSPDESLLYIADSGEPHHVRVFRVGADGALQGGEVFVVIDPGVPDGIRCAPDGRLFSSAGDGIHIFSPEGGLLEKIPVPETPANLCFGGPDGKTIFITARTSVYRVRVD